MDFVFVAGAFAVAVAVVDGHADPVCKSHATVVCNRSNLILRIDKFGNACLRYVHVQDIRVDHDRKLRSGHVPSRTWLWAVVYVTELGETETDGYYNDEDDAVVVAAPDTADTVLKATMLEHESDVQRQTSTVK